MRPLIRIGIVALLFVPLSGLRAEEDKEARAVLERAVKAIGGADKVTPLQGINFKTKGQFFVNEQKIDFSGDVAAQAQSRYRWQVQVTVENRTVSGLLVVDADKAWAMAEQQKTMDLPKEVAHIFRSDFRVVRLAQRLTPLLDKDVTLTHLGELKINDRPALGVKAVQKDMPDVDLYFDKETALLVRAQLRVKEESMEVEHTFSFDEFKEFNGIKQFTKLNLRRDDKPSLEMELDGFQLDEKLDGSLFARP